MHADMCIIIIVANKIIFSVQASGHSKELHIRCWEKSSLSPQCTLQLKCSVKHERFSHTREMDTNINHVTIGVRLPQLMKALWGLMPRWRCQSYTKAILAIDTLYHDEHKLFAWVCIQAESQENSRSGKWSTMKRIDHEKDRCQISKPSKY